MKSSGIFLLLSIVCGEFLFSQTGLDTFHWDPNRVEKDSWHSIEAASEISKDDKISLIEAMRSELRASMSDLSLTSEYDVQRSASQILMKAVDLSGKGSRDFLAQAADPLLCTPTGNCESGYFDGVLESIPLF